MGSQPGPEARAQQEVAGEPGPEAVVPAREPSPEPAARGRKEVRNKGTQGRRTLSAQPRVKYPRAGDRIQFKEGEEWHDVTVIG